MDSRPVAPSPPLGIAAVLLLSHDPESLAAFYRKHFAVPLRLVTVENLPRHWACDVGRVYLSIWSANDPAGTPEGGGLRTGSGGVAFHVRDVAAEHRRLTAAGVPCLFPPKHTPVGILARYQDPDGNPVETYQVLPGRNPGPTT
jgi:catechol 2,3-dioxygenase-like lactoylglutathione lyase family enzyme